MIKRGEWSFIDNDNVDDDDEEVEWVENLYTGEDYKMKSWPDCQSIIRYILCRLFKIKYIQC